MFIIYNRVWGKLTQFIDTILEIPMTKYNCMFVFPPKDGKTRENKGCQLFYHASFSCIFLKCGCTKLEYRDHHKERVCYKHLCNS